MTKTITETHLFTAACLWEAALDELRSYEAEGLSAKGFTAELAAYRLRHGTSQLREEVVALALACDVDWDGLLEHQKESAGAFDWEFVPKWLAANFFKTVRGL